jgi:hypothetical protein
MQTTKPTWIVADDETEKAFAGELCEVPEIIPVYPSTMMPESMILPMVVRFRGKIIVATLLGLLGFFLVVGGAYIQLRSLFSFGFSGNSPLSGENISNGITMVGAIFWGCLFLYLALKIFRNWRNEKNDSWIFSHEGVLVVSGGDSVRFAWADASIIGLNVYYNKKLRSIGTHSRSGLRLFRFQRRNEDAINRLRTLFITGFTSRVGRVRVGLLFG